MCSLFTIGACLTQKDWKSLKVMRGVRLILLCFNVKECETLLGAKAPKLRKKES